MHFLSRVGGIDKTEWVKRHAYLHRNDFDRIIFLSYQKSIVETVCQDSLLICRGESEKEENENSTREYADRLSKNVINTIAQGLI